MYPSACPAPGGPIALSLGLPWPLARALAVTIAPPARLRQSPGRHLQQMCVQLVPTASQAPCPLRSAPLGPTAQRWAPRWPLPVTPAPRASTAGGGGAGLPLRPQRPRLLLPRGLECLGGRGLRLRGGGNTAPRAPLRPSLAPRGCTKMPLSPARVLSALEATIALAAAQRPEKEEEGSGPMPCKREGAAKRMHVRLYLKG